MSGFWLANSIAPSVSSTAWWNDTTKNYTDSSFFFHVAQNCYYLDDGTGHPNSSPTGKNTKVWFREVKNVGGEDVATPIEVDYILESGKCYTKLTGYDWEKDPTGTS